MFTRVAAVLVFAFLLSHGARAERPPPIDPAYAAEQPEMNSETIAYEFIQFQALGRWHQSLDQMEIAASRRDFLQKNFERVEKLKNKGHTTNDSYYRTRFLAIAAANDVLRLQLEAEMAKASMQVAKMRILDYGNPSVDLRRQIIAARTDELDNLIKGQRLALVNVELEQKLAESRATIGVKLKQKDNVSELESDTRLLSAEVLGKQAESLRNQIATNTRALRGLELSLARVEKDGPRAPAKLLK